MPRKVKELQNYIILQQKEAPSSDKSLDYIILVDQTKHNENALPLVREN